MLSAHPRSQVGAQVAAKGWVLEEKHILDLIHHRVCLAASLCKHWVTKFVGGTGSWERSTGRLSSRWASLFRDTPPYDQPPLLPALVTHVHFWTMGNSSRSLQQVSFLSQWAEVGEWSGRGLTSQRVLLASGDSAEMVARQLCFIS